MNTSFALRQFLLLLGVLLLSFGTGCARRVTQGASSPEYCALSFSYYVMSGDVELALRFVSPSTVTALGGSQEALGFLHRLHERWTADEWMSVKVTDVEENRANVIVTVRIQRRNYKLKELRWQLQKLGGAYYINPATL